jgi:hypothetical protein
MKSTRAIAYSSHCATAIALANNPHPICAASHLLNGWDKILVWINSPTLLIVLDTSTKTLTADANGQRFLFRIEGLVESPCGGITEFCIYPRDYPLTPLVESSMHCHLPGLFSEVPDKGQAGIPK